MVEEPTNYPTESSNPGWDNYCDSNEDLVKALSNVSNAELQGVAEALSQDKEESGSVYTYDELMWWNIKKVPKDSMLFLHGQHLGSEWAKTISNIQLNDWVQVLMENNNIWDEGAKAISKMELYERVTLDLWGNNISDEGVKAIMKNMTLKNGVILMLQKNNITEGMKVELEKWRQSYIEMWVNCVILY